MIPILEQAVHYVMSEGPLAGQHVDALVIRVWGRREVRRLDSGMCDVEVVADALADKEIRGHYSDPYVRLGIPYANDGGVNSWHEPELCAPIQTPDGPVDPAIELRSRVTDIMLDVREAKYQIEEGYRVIDEATGRLDGLTAELVTAGLIAPAPVEVADTFNTSNTDDQAEDKADA